MKIIFYADDYSLTYGMTEAIKDCISKGILTNSCVRTNGEAYNYARSVSKKIKNKISGLHLNITDGKAENKNLADANGNFKYGFINYLYLSYQKSILKEIEKEFELQFSKAKKDGFKIDHINSQEHVHMIPPIFELVCKLCKKHKIRKLRFVHESFHLTNKFTKNIEIILNFNLIRLILLNFFSKMNIKYLNRYNLKTTDGFSGLLYSNNMDFDSIKSYTNKALKENLRIVEILAHPAYQDDRDKNFTSSAISKYSNLPNRKLELETFLDTRNKIKKFMKKNNISFATYKDII